MKRGNTIKIIFAGMSLTAFLLGGCSSGNSDGGNSKAEAEKVNVVSADEVLNGPEIEVTFWHAMGGTNGEALNKIVEEFNSKNKGHIKVMAQFQGSYDDELNKLKSAQMAGQGPNVIQVYDIGTRYMLDSGWAVPVQAFIDADKWDKQQIEPNLLAYYEIDKKLYSMPFNSSTPLLYYNKDAFKESGLDPENPPKTLEDIIAVSDKLKKKDSSGETVRYAYGMYTYGWWFEQLMAKELLPIYDNGNGRDAAPTKVVFDENGGGAKILKIWNRLIKEDVMPKYAMNSDDCTSAFANGKIAMTVGSTAGLASTLAAVGDKFELGTGYFPAVDKESKGGVSIGGASLWIMDNQDDKIERAAWEFIKFAASPEQQAFWNTKTGYFPITKGAYDQQLYKDNVAKYPQFEMAVKQLRESPAESKGGLCAIYTQARQIVETNITKMLNGEQSEEETLSAITKSINTAISDYNLAN
jgi:sn-glycerol 3-phosphate transport system substrate-binding protein